ncbi:hypothetical protein BX600DRAFT_554726 [Xylariales sp. PMI_506]|nr:hypothetical protein BX600DRAFT_554726 [Xylariales sp. PMI_506]
MTTMASLRHTVTFLLGLLACSITTASQADQTCATIELTKTVTATKTVTVPYPALSSTNPLQPYLTTVITTVAYTTTKYRSLSSTKTETAGAVGGSGATASTLLPCNNSTAATAAAVTLSTTTETVINATVTLPCGASGGGLTTKSNSPVSKTGAVGGGAAGVTGTTHRVTATTASSGSYYPSYTAPPEVTSGTAAEVPGSPLLAAGWTFVVMIAVMGMV